MNELTEFRDITSPEREREFVDQLKDAEQENLALSMRWEKDQQTQVAWGHPRAQG